MSRQKWISPEYNIVITDEEAKKAFTEIRKHHQLAFDVETTGLSFVQDKIIGFSFVYRDLKNKKLYGYYFPIRHKLGKKETIYGFSLMTEPGEEFKTQVSINTAINEISAILCSKNHLLIGQNLKFDIGMLYQEFIPRPDEFMQCSLFDTRVAEAMIDSLKVNEKKRGTLSLKNIIHDYIDFVGPDTIKKWKDFEGALAECSIVEVGEYCINDAAYAYMLYETQESEIKENYSDLFYKVEMPLIPVLCRIEYQGINIDRDYLTKLDKEISPELERLEEEFQRLSGKKINLKSSVKLREYLYEELKLEPITKRVRRKSGSEKILATDSDSIEIIMSKMEKKDKTYNILSVIVDYLKLYSVKKTYIDGFLKRSAYDSKIHSDYDSVGARSSRFSSTPNLQNLPRDKKRYDIRKAFIPSKEKEFSVADWKGMQLRIAAAMSKDPVMVKAFQEGEDLHRKTAQTVFEVSVPTEEQRDIGKTINFAILFGATEYIISTLMKCPRKKARKVVKDFYKLYAGFAQWKTKLDFEIERDGYALTADGRKRKYNYTTMFPDYEMRSIINTVIQGTEADILKKSLVLLEKKLKQFPEWKARIVVHIHDEIIVENDPLFRGAVQGTMSACMTWTLRGIALPVEISTKQSLSKKDD